jgi:hypothetical protein
MYKDSVLNLKFNNLKPYQIVKEYKKIKIFNDKKLLLLECIYRGDTKLRLFRHYQYNIKNELIRHKDYMDDCSVDFDFEYKYDNRGNKIYERKHDYVRTVYTYWTYDKNNKLIEEKGISSDSLINYLIKDNKYIYRKEHLPHF